MPEMLLCLFNFSAFDLFNLLQKKKCDLNYKLTDKSVTILCNIKALLTIIGTNPSFTVPSE